MFMGKTDLIQSLTIIYYGRTVSVYGISTIIHVACYSLRYHSDNSFLIITNLMLEIIIAII